MRFFRVMFMSLFLLFVSFCVLLSGFTLEFLKEKKSELPDISWIKEYEPSTTTDIYSGDEKLASLALEHRKNISYDEMPLNMINAFIASEDERFWEHNGFDIYAFSRAMISNLQRHSDGKRLHGASTISQQVAKMLITGNERTVDRKIKEALLSVELERQIGKKKILELYANQTYFGYGAYGILVASNVYFGKHIDDLNIAEYAFLAGLPKAPSKYDPVDNYIESKQRRTYVLSRMKEVGIITQNEFDFFDEYPMPVPKKIEDGIDNYFLEEVRKELMSEYGYDKIYKEGMKVNITFDSKIQNIAENALLKGLQEYENRQFYVPLIENYTENVTVEKLLLVKQKYKIPQYYNVGFAKDKEHIFLDNGLEIKIDNKNVKTGDIVVYDLSNNVVVNYTGVEGAVLVMKNQGDVLAMVGGRDFKNSIFNRTTQAQRQPGSSFKPLIYLTALEQGLDLQSPVLDMPIAIEAGGNEIWRPNNYTEKSGGLMTLENAFIQSKNLATARLVYDLGLDTVMNTLNRFDFYPKEKNYSVALGASETTMLKMGTMFSVFTNGGYKVKPRLIKAVNDIEFGIDLSEKIVEHQFLEPMKSLLQGVVKKGTAASSLSKIPYDIGGKTGTTNDAYDAWFVGYLDDLVIVVWVGYDNPRTLGDKETGGKISAPIFGEIVNNIKKLN